VAKLVLRNKSTKTLNSLTGLSVVIPVYKEDPALVTRTYCELAMRGAEVIVVDDGDTVDLDDSLNEISYRPNMGYGYALKTGIKAATNHIVLTMDGDGEHTVEDAEKLYKVYNLITDCSMLVGCRWTKKEKASRWIGRKAINFLAVCWTRHMLPDLNSGMRIFKKELAMGYAPILCDTFSFTTSLTMSMVTDGHKVAWFPIDTKPRVYGKSKVKLIRDGFITVFYIFYIGFALRTRKIRQTFRSYFSFFHRNDV